MAQHFLLSAEARTLSLKAIYQQGEEVAYRRFSQLRWPDTKASPVCPRCGCEKAYAITTRRKFKCKACNRQFSVTSGTMFASHKLRFVDLLGAIALIANSAEGLSSFQLARCFDVSYKTAFVLAHKLRDALSIETKELTLMDTVEMMAPTSAVTSDLRMRLPIGWIAGCAPIAVEIGAALLPYVRGGRAR